MRQVGGTGSDVDGTKLRQRENAARKRKSDVDIMLPGPTLLQHA